MASSDLTGDWPLWEVFVRARQGLSHSMWAACTRRTRRWRSRTRATSTPAAGKGESIWVVRSTDVVASAPDDKDALFDPADDKIYRHPTFYTVPDGVENL